MAPSHPKPSRWFTTLLWGNSIALSWMWGLGLFFSVQFTTQFGLFGLLTFAIPNALGLLAFGLVTHHIARREAGSESLARFFKTWSRPFRLVFFLYQLLAITLTIFAFIRYLLAAARFSTLGAIFAVDSADRARRVRAAWRGVRYHPDSLQPRRHGGDPAGGNLLVAGDRDLDWARSGELPKTSNQ